MDLIDTLFDMKFSIITVNFNNPEGLERTIRSVINQTSTDYEYIVVDGDSTKGDVEVIHKYEPYINSWVSEKDTGIYNAMNKGVRMASGEYCLFINSGDELYSPSMLEEVAAKGISADFVQGVICRPGKKETFVNPPQEKDITLGWYVWGNNNYHQASLIKRDLLIAHPYDEVLKVASDLKFNVEVLIKHGCSYQPIDVVIAKYEYGGVSSQKKHADESKILFASLFGDRIMKDYYQLMYTHRFPINRIMPTLRSISTWTLWNKFRRNVNR